MDHQIPCYMIHSEMRVSWKSHLKLFSVTTGDMNCGVIFSLWLPPVVVYQTDKVTVN